MTSVQSGDDANRPEPDPVDEAAATIDARSPDAPERIEGLEDYAESVDRDRSAEKPTDEWVTGDEPMTGPQASYLRTLAREAGEDVPDGLTKAQASEMIDRLQSATGRGTTNQSSAGDRELPLDPVGPTELGDAST